MFTLEVEKQQWGMSTIHSQIYINVLLAVIAVTNNSQH